MKITMASLVLASALISVQPGTGLAAWGDGPGCGFGKMVFTTEPKSILLQHFGSTLNVPTQPFAITSGTSGCTNNGMIVKEDRATVFASVNYDNLSQEMAQGSGEHLASLATLLGVPPDRQLGFFSLVQAHYRSLVQAGDNSPQTMLIALQAAVAEQPDLSTVPRKH
ncbi:MAG: DUF3015 family protein [Nitrospira sp.]